MSKHLRIWLFVLLGTLLSSTSLLAEGVITMTTFKSVGESIELHIMANGDVSITGARMNGRDSYSLSSQTITIRGDVTELDCSDNQLTSLDVSGCTALTTLYCQYNQLTSLDLSTCSSLNYVNCSINQIKEEAMSQLVASLPTYNSGNEGESGEFIVVSNFAQEGNFCSKANVASARAKNWNSLKEASIMHAFALVPYEGEDDNLQVGNGVITMTTTEAVGETIAIAIKADGGVAIEGVKFFLQPDGHIACYTLTSQTVTIRGNVTRLDCSDNQLTSLDVSKNSSLTALVCSDNQLTSLDVSSCTALTKLDCKENQLSILDVSKNTALTTLYCYGNKLTRLDVSGCTALTELYCLNNQLTSLNLSGCAALTMLNCGGNQLTTLDVTGCPFLKVFGCYVNQLTSLDVSKNNFLTALSCSYNQLTSLEVSGCPSLNYLDCSANQIKGKAMTQLVASLPTCTSDYPDRSHRYNYSGGYFIVVSNSAQEGNFCSEADLASAREKNWTSLKSIDGELIPYKGESDNPQQPVGSGIIKMTTTRAIGEIIKLGFKANGRVVIEGAKTPLQPDGHIAYYTLTSQTIIIRGDVTELNCAVNQLTSLDVSGCPSLIKLSCGSLSSEKGTLTSLKASGCTALTELDCRNIQLSSLDVSGCTSLTTLYCSNNQLTGLDLSGCPALTKLDCSSNKLTSLDVSKNTALTSLSCAGNQLTSLDVSKNTTLTSLGCEDNQLTSLDVSNCTSLTSLVCGGLFGDRGALRSLNVSGCTALTTLDCQCNQLTSLDVSGCSALTKLDCWNNRLTSLDVSKNPALTQLDCGYNQLTSLDLSSCPSLTELDCGYNQLTSLDLSKCLNLRYVDCSRNRIKGEAMNRLVASLPTCSGDYRGEYNNGRYSEHSSYPGGYFVAVSSSDNEWNNCSKENVASARAKNWTPLNKKNGFKYYSLELVPYEGVDLNQPVGHGVITMTTERAVGKSITLLFKANGSVALEGVKEILQSDGSTTYQILPGQTITLRGDVTALSCGESELTSLNVSGCPSLTQLLCWGNQLTNLDVSQNRALTDLQCHKNQLTSLDMSQNSVLALLSCGDNQLTNLDVSQNAALEFLDCNSNQLTSLDLSQNLSLYALYCQSNRLTSLDFSHNSDLRELRCYYNQIKGAEMSKLVNGLPQMDRRYKSNFYVVVKDSIEGNVCLKSDVAIVADKGWTPLGYNKSTELWEYYGGRETDSFGVSLTHEGEGLLDATGADNLKAVPYGTKLTITATPAEGYELVALTANGLDILESKSFEVTGYTEIKATFAKKSFAVTFAKEGEGTITATGASNLNSVAYGTELTINATPAEGYELTALTANGTDILASKKVTVKEAVEVKATFSKKTFTVTLEKVGVGELSTTGTDNLNKVPYGTELTIIATPAEGYELTSIVVDGVNITDSKKIVVKDNLTVKATFSKKSFAVSLTKEGEGTITATGASNLNAVAYGTELTIVATPAAGYELQSLVIDGVVNITATKKVVVTDNVTIKATFAKKSFAVSLTKEGEGTISATGASDLNAVAYGTELTINATPAEGYELTALTANGTDILASKMVVVTDNITVKATFEKKTFAVTLTSNEHGEITIVEPVDLKAVPYGTTLTVKATGKNAQCVLTELTANGKDILATRSFVVTDVTEVKATFVDHTGVETTVTQQTQLYPNPATDYVIVEGIAPASEVTLHSMTGERLYAGRADDRGALQIDLTPYADGVYLVCVAGETYRVVVRH